MPLLLVPLLLLSRTECKTSDALLLDGDTDVGADAVPLPLMLLLLLLLLLLLTMYTLYATVSRGSG